MAEAREQERIVLDARETVDASATLDAALEAVASILVGRFRVSRVSVRTYDPATDDVVFDGVWSSEPTLLVAGVRMPARSTTFAEVELRGSAILGHPTPKTGPLLDQVLRDEGTRSWVVAPLTRDRILVGLLSVASPDADGLTEADLPFFDALAGGIGERVLRLASA